MRRIALRSLLALVVLLVLVAGGGYLWLRTSLPVTSGALTLAGLEAPVSISRDALGVPTIRARSDRDAAFALGFLHAQDRLFQMDLMRRFGAGRLSEWFGPQTLGTDRFVRTLGFYRAAEAEFSHLSTPLRAALDAYAAGVNAFLARHGGALPPEYQLLRAQPEPWRPADTLVWGKIMDLQLSGNFRGEILHARLLQRLSPEEVQVLYPGYPADGPVTLRDAKAALLGLPLEGLLAATPALAGPQRASNNWVVDGAHSESGKPLLANDPHLDFSTPSVWYLARIETPDAKLAGVTAPGTPLVVIGHNEHVAWGFTTTGSDVADLFIEKVDPEHPDRYLTPEGSEPFVVRHEEIGVRDAAPVPLTVRATRHGPVYSDLGGSAASLAGADRVLALETTWLGDDDRTPDAIWNLARARDWQGFRAALRDMVAPQQNIVYADVDGNIGFAAPARIPIRAKGDGWVPVPGWTGEYDWTGWVPDDALPAALNPPKGRIVTANNKIVPDDYPYFLSRDWDQPYRARRIEALLEAKPKHAPDGFAAIEADDLSGVAQELLPLLLAPPPASPRAAQAVAMLKAWDARMDRARPEPLVFTAWLRELSRALLAPRLGPLVDEYWNLRPEVVRAILTGHEDWCDDPTTAGVESCAERIAQTLDRALDGLGQTYGQDMGAWRWGVPHQAVFADRFWSQVPAFARWLDLRIPADGANDTVNAGGIAVYDEAAPFADRHGPTLRMIVDMAAPDRARFLIAPGQSGNPLSPHRADLMARWRDFAWLELGEDASGGTLTLSPP